MNPTITRYLIGAAVRPFAVVLGVLVGLFASYSIANLVADPVNGLLPISAILKLTLLKAVISLDVLIPVSLYVSIILAFARLHDNLEFVAMGALSMQRWVVARAVLVLAGSLALVVGFVSLCARPWAYAQLHEVTRVAATMLDVDAMASGSFYVDQDGGRVIFLSRRDKAGAPARDVFVRLRRDDRTQIITARRASALPPEHPGAGTEVYMDDANIYEIDRADGQPDDVVQADGVVIDPNSHGIGPPDETPVTSSTWRMLGSTNVEDVAELQWRLSTPVSTLLLGLLAIPLSQRRPREGGTAQFITAFAIYIGYYLLGTSTRTLVQHGAIPRFPGIWWVPALLSLVLATIITNPRLEFGFRHRRI